MVNKATKVTLINPPHLTQHRYGNDLKNFGPISEPLGLAYLAGTLEKDNYAVSIIDAVVLNLSNDDVIKILVKDAPALIGITAVTPAYNIMKDLAEMIKRVLPNTKIIAGGPHVTALPQETIANIKEIDFICIGEGEETIVEVIKFLEGGKKITDINGLVYRKDGKIVFNRPREFIKNLDGIPPPARHLLPMEKYVLTTSRSRGAGYCPTLIIARGCPFDCYFCSHTFGRTFRHHSTERILSEIEYLISNYGIKQLNFEADTLTSDKRFILDLCRLLIKSGISKKVKWTCESRIDTVDDDILKLMKKAGCWQISYGVESGVQHLLDTINKGQKLEQVEKVFKLTRRNGISIRAFFMLGLPGETIEESWQTINFAKKLDPLWAQFTVTIPFPGTPLFTMLKNRNEIRTFDWYHYNSWAGWIDEADNQLPYISNGRIQEELLRLQKEALTSFYLRPKQIIKYFRQVNSLKTLAKYFLAFYVLLKNRLPMATLKKYRHAFFGL